MANVVGDAYVVVRAITAGVEKQIADAFNNTDRIGRDAGEASGSAYQRGFNKSTSKGEGFFSAARLKRAEATARSFSDLTRKLYFLQPAIVGVAGLIGTLGTALISLASVVGATVGPALLVLVGSFTALAQAAITAKLAFSGVAKAIAAGTKASKAGAGAAKKEADLRERIRRAQVDYAKLIRDNAKAEEDGRKRVTDANKDYVDSLREAKEELQELAFSSEDAAISEQKAALDLEKAREALARVADLPPNSRARKEAELAFAEADLNYRRAIDANNDLKEQEAKNAALGPDLDSQVKGQEKVIAADEERKESLGALKNMIIDNKEAQKRAAYDLAELKKGNDDATGATDAYKDALDGLGPAQRKFVEYMVKTFIPSLKALRVAAGKELFPRLETALEILRTKLFPALIPLLEGTGKVLGDIAVKIAKTITESKNLDRIKNIWKTNDTFVTNLGTALDNLVTVFLVLVEAAKPLIDAFGKFLVKITAAWKETLTAEGAAKKLEDRFLIVKGIFSDLGTIFGNVFGGIGKIIDANIGPGSGGQILLDYFKEASEKFKNLKTIDGKPLKEFFADAAENAKPLLTLIGKIAGNFIKLADNPELGIFFTQLGTVADIFGRIGEDLAGALPSFGEFLIQFSLLVEKFTESGSIEKFFTILGKIFKALNTFFDSPVGKFFITASSFILPIAAALGAVSIAATFFGRVVLGNVSRAVGIFGNVGRAVGGLKAKITGLKAGDPFIGLRKGSGLTRVELQKQMIVDTQKKNALNGVYISAGKAATNIRQMGVASGTATPLIGAAGTKASISAKLMTGLGVAGRAAGAGLRAAGRGLALVGGPIGILLLLVPLIIQNWDKISAFFKELGPNLVKIFKAIWDKIKDIVPELFDKVKEIVGNVIEWVKENWPLILAIFTGPFGLIILAIVKNWDDILAFIKGLPAKLLEIGSKIWDWIVDTFKTAVDLYIGAWSAIFTFIKELPGKLLDVGKKVWDWIVDVFITAKDNFIANWTAIFTFIGELGGKLKEKGLLIWQWIVDLVKERIENVKTNFGLLIEFVKELPKKLKDGALTIFTWVTDLLGTVIQSAKDKFGSFISYIKTLPALIASAASGMFNGLKTAFVSAINFVIGKWNNLSFSLKLPEKVFGIPLGPLAGKGFTLNTPDITPFKLAKGGIVSPSAGGTLSLIGEAGRPERIEPLDPDGLSKRDKAMIELLSGPNRGITIVVNPSAGMDERELASIVSRQLSYAMRKGAA